jgi:hypothetical protein
LFVIVYAEDDFLWAHGGGDSSLFQILSFNFGVPFQAHVVLDRCNGFLRRKKKRQLPLAMEDLPG